MGKRYKYGGCSGGWENNTNVEVVVVDGKTIKMWWSQWRVGKRYKCGVAKGAWENNTNVEVVVELETIQQKCGRGGCGGKLEMQRNMKGGW